MGVVFLEKRGHPSLTPLFWVAAIQKRALIPCIAVDAVWSSHIHSLLVFSMLNSILQVCSGTRVLRNRSAGHHRQIERIKYQDLVGEFPRRTCFRSRITGNSQLLQRLADSNDGQLDVQYFRRSISIFYALIPTERAERDSWVIWQYSVVWFHVPLARSPRHAS